MSIFKTEIRGPAKAIIIGVLAGLFVGAVGGAIYGDILAERKMQLEMLDLKAGRVNYRSIDGNIPEKVSGHIYASGRATGLRFGIPIGAIFGLACGVVAGWLGWSARKSEPC
jgi:hypothetical protein